MPTFTFATLSLMTMTLFQGSQAMSISPPSELLNPALWNAAPIIEWDKFYAQNPESERSFVYDPPQRYGRGSRRVSLPLIGKRAQTLMEYYFVKETLTPEEIAACAKPNAAKVSEDLIEKMLSPNPDSSKVAKPFRNHLFWMEDNHTAEELVTFNRWAWRSQTEGDGRVIALGNMGYGWTNDASKMGAGLSSMGSLNISIKESPCKKFYMLAASMPRGLGLSWMTMYVIQEGDVLVDRDGTPVPNVSPGDLLRRSYGDATDPYNCSTDDCVFEYIVRRVATFNEETGKVERNASQYESIMAKVNAPLPEGLENVAHLTLPERFDLSRKTVCDLQIYKTAPVPPTGAEIEDL